MNYPPKMPFFNFCLFHFFKFLLTISKLLWKNHPFFIGSSEVLLHHKCFQFFDNDTTTLFLKFAWKCVFFVYFLFNKRNLNLFFDVTCKRCFCAFCRSELNYGPSNMLFLFLSFLSFFIIIRMSNLASLKKGIVFPRHFVYELFRNIFAMLSSISLSNFIL